MEKKLILRNIFGKPVKIKDGGESSESIISVSTLPREGEIGKIYYNTTEDKYYVYDNATHKYTDLSSATIKVIDDIDDVGIVDLSPEVNTYRLRPGVFYNIDDWNKGGESDTSLVFVFERGNGIYAGRFTAWADNLNITWPTTVDNIDEENVEIISGHTYEFNVWQGVLILVDVTSTEQGGE